MDVFKSNIQDTSHLDIDDEVKEKLNDGIQYIFSIVTKLQQNSPDDKYEIHGTVMTNKLYYLSINAESYSKEHPKSGWVTHPGVYFLLMNIYYNNGSDRPTIYISLINARGNLLSGNSIIDISKKFGEKINASNISLTDGSGIMSICKGKHFSMTYL